MRLPDPRSGQTTSGAQDRLYSPRKAGPRQCTPPASAAGFSLLLAGLSARRENRLSGDRKSVNRYPTSKARSRVEHWLTLLISPLWISLLVAVLVAVGTNVTVSGNLWITLLLVTALWLASFLAAYTTAFSTSLRRWARWRRRRRFATPRVLVLDGRIDDEGIPCVERVWTTKKPDEWQEEISRQNPTWTVELGSVEHALDNGVDIIVNPFGEAYPEEDLSLHTTFTRLRDYVRGGGVFVNVAGYPFWWKTNPMTRMRVEAGRWEQQSPGLMILKPLLPDLLNVFPILPSGSHDMNTKQDGLDFRRFGEIAGAGGGNDAKVFRAYPDSTTGMIPLLRTSDGQSIVIGAVSFGAGHFIFAGVEIDGASKSFHKVLAAIAGWARYERSGRPAG